MVERYAGPLARPLEVRSLLGEPRGPVIVAQRQQPFPRPCEQAAAAGIGIAERRMAPYRLAAGLGARKRAEPAHVDREDAAGHLRRFA